MKKIILAICIVCTVFSSSPSNATTILNDTKIELNNGINEWSKTIWKSFRKLLEEYRTGKIEHFPSYTECREVSEQPGLYICASALSLTQNKMFCGLTGYSDAAFGITKQNTLNDLKNPKNSREIEFCQYLVSGHDLPSWNLAAYFEKTKGYFSSVEEKEFYENIYLPTKNKLGTKPFVIVSFSTQTQKPNFITVAHEVLHSHYFLNKKFRTTIDSFWEKNVSKEDKKEIFDIFEPYYGVKKDPSLLRNEFQAYLLQPEAENAYLGKFLPKYREQLLKELEKNGIKPIQMKNE